MLVWEDEVTLPSTTGRTELEISGAARFDGVVEGSVTSSSQTSMCVRPKVPNYRSVGFKHQALLDKQMALLEKLAIVSISAGDQGLQTGRPVRLQ